VLPHHLDTLCDLLPILDGFGSAELLLHLHNLVLEPVHLHTAKGGGFRLGADTPYDFLCVNGRYRKFVLRYRDFNNLIGFISKSCQIIFLKMCVKNVFQFPFLANLHS
jgi:hypothetical protein